MNAVLGFVLAAVFAFPAAAQLSPKDRPFDVPFAGDCGLITRYSANRIPPSCLQDSLNILYDEDFSYLRRNGYAKYNATPCTNSRSVRGLWKFNATDGTKYMVILSSQSFFSTHGAGDCTAISGAWSYDATAEFSCVQAIGKLWCGNGIDSPFSWDGTSTAPVSGMPTGGLVGTFRNRILVADVAGAFTRVRLSGELDGTDWTVQIPGRSTTPANIDISGTHDGKRVTCLLGEYQNAYYIGREDDLYGLYGNDRRDFTLRKISNEVGCIEPKSVQEKNNALYWISKRGMEKMSGTTIESVSDGIKPTINEIIASAGNTRTKTYSSQSDWESGNLNVSGSSAAMSSTISLGNVVPASATVSDYSGVDFGSGTLLNVSTTDVSGSVVLSSTVVQDDFTDGNYTAGPAWTVTDGAFTVSGGYLTAASVSGTNTAWTESHVATGSWRFIHNYTTTDSTARCSMGTSDICLQYRFMQNAGGDYYSFRLIEKAAEITAAFYRTITGSAVLLSSVTITAYPQSSDAIWTIYRSTWGRLEAYYGSTFEVSATDTSISSATRTEIVLLEQGFYSVNRFTGLYAYHYRSPGTFTSRIFDTGFSTPTGGPFISTYTFSPGETYVSFDVRSSTSSRDDKWSAWSASSDTLRVSATQQFWQYRSQFATDIPTKTPTLDDVSMVSATTGYYITPCVSIGSAITSWGRLRSNYVSNGGALAFYVSTGATCGAAIASTATWNSQIVNSAISVVTATYAAARTLFTMDSATQVPTMNDVTIEWNEGGARPPVASAVYNDRYHLFYTTSTASGAANDRELVLDRRDKWTLFQGANAYSALVYERKLYTGDSANSGFIYLQDAGDNDAGAAFTYRFRTADLDMGDPSSRKMFKVLYVTAHSEADPTQNIVLTMRYRIDGSSTSYPLGTVNLDEAAEPGYIVAKVPFPQGQRTDGHWISLEFENSGTQGPIKVYSIRIIYEALEPD